MISRVLKTAREFTTKNFTLCLVILIFFSSRVIYFLYFHVRFDASPLGSYWQYIDTKLLKDNLLQSVFYLHSAPPLYNMFLGVVLKLFPGSYSVAFWLVYMVLGALFSVALFLLMRDLGIRSPLSSGLACLYTVSPLFVDYENWLFYEYPTAALLTGAALFLHRFIVHKKTTDCFIFFLLLALVIYVRGLFSLYCFLAVLILLLAFHSALWKKIIRGSAVSLILILALYLKQYAVFGTFSINDALIGQNLAVTVMDSLPKNTVNTLIAQNKISGLSRTGIFPRIFQYERYGIPRRVTGVPVLDERKRSSGWINSNHLMYLDVGRRDLKDAIYVLRHYPGVVLRNRVKIMLKKYFLTSDQASPYIVQRSSRWIIWREYYKRFILGADTSGRSVFLSVGIPFLLLYGLFMIYRSFITQGVTSPRGAVVLFMLATILYLIVTTAFIISDRSRYRFLVDPFYLILFGLCLHDVLDMLGRYRRSIGAGRRAFFRPKTR